MSIVEKLKEIHEALSRYKEVKEERDNLKKQLGEIESWVDTVYQDIKEVEEGEESQQPPGKGEDSKS